MILREVVVPAGPDELWDLLTDPALCEEWLGGRLEWEVETGSPLRFVPAGLEDGPPREGRVDEVDPERLLRFTWWPAPGNDVATEVTWVLAPGPDGGTLLTVSEAPAVSAEALPQATASAWTVSDDLELRVWARASGLSALTAIG
jgi:uncharacterized protein YndB with AHSA1/START domain